MATRRPFPVLGDENPLDGRAGRGLRCRQPGGGAAARRRPGDLRGERRSADARRRDPAGRCLPAGRRHPAAGAAATHAVFQASEVADNNFRVLAAQGLRGDRAGHRGPLHVRGRGPPARRGRRRLRHRGVGPHVAVQQRQGRDVRRQLSGDDATAGGDRSARRPGGAVSGLVLQQPLRHGVSGRCVLSERWPGLESRTDDGRPAPGVHAGRESEPRHRNDQGDVRGLPQPLAVARAAQDDGRARPEEVRARLSGAAEPSQLRSVLGDLRYRSEARPYPGSGSSPHRVVRHAAHRHVAQLRRAARSTPATRRRGAISGWSSGPGPTPGRR